MKSALARYRFGPFELDPVRYELRRGGRRIRLSTSLMELLSLFVARQGELVTREQIVAVMWKEPESVDIRQGINTAVGRLRAALGDDPADPRYLETVIGKGYRFIEIVEEIAVDEPETVVATQTAPDERSTEPLVYLPSDPHHLNGHNPAPNLFGVTALRSRLLSWPNVVGLITVFPLVALLAVVSMKYRSGSSTLWTMREITNNDAEIPVDAAALSANGQSLAYTTASGLFLRNMTTGRLRQISGPPLRATRLAWFPDLRRILVTGYAANSTQPEIWSTSTEGGVPQLFRRAADSGVPSPNGKSIAFTSEDGREIHITDVGKGSDLILDKEGAAGTFSTLFWSADGRRISYQQLHTGSSPLESDHVWSYGSRIVETGEQTTMVRDLPFDSATESADGSIFYLRARAGQNPENRGMWRLTTDPRTGVPRGNPLPICCAVNLDRLAQISVAADGKEVAAIKEFWQPDVFVGDLQVPGPTLDHVHRLTTNTRSDFPHAWDQKSQFVYFESDREGSDLYHIFRQQPGQADAEILTTGKDAQILPSVMPDGKTLVYELRDHVLGDKLRSVFRANLDGSNPRLVLKEAALDEWRCPVLTGTACVLRETDAQHFLFYALDLDQGKGRLLARSASLPVLMGDWALSPDGRVAAIPDHDENAPSIHLIHLDGLESETKISIQKPMHLRGLAWAPDSSGFFAGADVGAASRLVFISINGKATELRNTTIGTWAVPSPDGKKLAFVDSATSRNVYTWQ